MQIKSETHFLFKTYLQLSGLKNIKTKHERKSKNSNVKIVALFLKIKTLKLIKHAIKKIVQNKFKNTMVIVIMKQNC